MLRVCELFGETIRNVFGVVGILLLNVMDVFSVCSGAILLLNVMDVFSVRSGALLDRPCMVFQRVCVLCL